MTTIDNPDKKFGAGKTIMLAMPDVVGLSDVIIKNLKYHGFTVIDGTYHPFSYKNNWEKVYKFLRHVFLGERNYKAKSQAKKFLEHNLSQQFYAHGLTYGKDKLDYTLFIHASVFEPLVFDKVCQLAHHNVAYHWDGFNIFPEIMEYIPKFERFFAFDVDDIKNNPQLNLLSTTNFYFDFDNNEIHNLTSYNSDNPSIYFVGRHWSNRTPMIDDFLEKVSQFDVDFQFYILDDKNTAKQEYKHSEKIYFLEKSMDFETNLHHVKNSDILVDFVKAEHNGLSFRFFESIHYQKKLITNNSKVTEYDLYHPNNIFVWDKLTFDVAEFQKFLKEPYVILDNSITDKYAFGNWIRYILNIQPNTPLSLLS